MLTFDVPEFITFDDSLEHRLPHPALLDCHYRLAKFFDMTGMGEVIDKTLEQWRNTRGESVLAGDGTTDLASLIEMAKWECVRV